MRLGFTGTRNGLTPEQDQELVKAIREWIPITSHFHHGCCVGADAEFHRIIEAEQMLTGLFAGSINVHPPTIHRYMIDSLPMGINDVWWPELPYLARNRVIVDNSDLLIACPASMTNRSGGTWYTVRYAAERGVLTYLIEPSGDSELLARLTTSPRT